MKSEFKGRAGPISLPLLLKLNQALNKTVFSRKFYQEVNDKILTKASTIDANLYFICYFTLLVSSVLNNKKHIKAFLGKQIRNLMSVTRAMTRTSSEMRVEKQALEKEEAAQEEKGVPSKTAVHLKAISSYLSDIRIFNRLVELIRYMPWIIDEFAALMNPGLAVPRLDRLVNFGQAINCLILELLENAGWLTEHNWVATGDNNYWCIETYIWCSRVWGAYLVIEIIELFRRVPRSKRNKDWRINLFTQLVQLPLVVHWSLYEGCLTPFWVGLCGSGASWFGFRNTWRSLDY